MICNMLLVGRTVSDDGELFFIEFLKKVASIRNSKRKVGTLISTK